MRLSKILSLSKDDQPDDAKALAALRPSTTLTRRLFLLLAVVLLSGCGAFEDNGTHLAYALEKAAKELRASNATEIVVHYEPLDGINGSYYVEITPSLNESGQSSSVWGSYLVVSRKTSGGTSHHNRLSSCPSGSTSRRTGPRPKSS